MNQRTASLPPSTNSLDARFRNNLRRSHRNNQSKKRTNPATFVTSRELCLWLTLGKTSNNCSRKLKTSFLDEVIKTRQIERSNHNLNCNSPPSVIATPFNDKIIRFDSVEGKIEFFLFQAELETAPQPFRSSHRRQTEGRASSHR